MNKPAEKNQDAEDARNVAILREHMTAEVEGLRESLAVWIEENTQHPIDAAVSIAMLETAFDRYIDLLGATDARRPRPTPLILPDRIKISSPRQEPREATNVLLSTFVYI